MGIGGAVMNVPILRYFGYAAIGFIIAFWSNRFFNWIFSSAAAIGFIIHNLMALGLDKSKLRFSSFL